MMMMVELRERKDRRKKKGGKTDAKLTISNISYQKAKELIDDWVSEICDCFCFSFIGQRRCVYMIS
jgi:hypothetical protein